jgi:hypothetical protein
MSQREWQETTAANRLMKQCPIALRRCLRCDHWLRSTGPDHRICNTCACVNVALFRGARIGKRYSTL